MRRRGSRLLEMELESLVVPQANAAEEAGKLVQDLPRLWAVANLTERRRLLLTMLDAVYVDAKEGKRIVATKPKPPFMPVFQVVTMREESGVLLTEDGPPETSPEARRCFWWRRGRVERYLKHGLTFCIFDNTPTSVAHRVFLAVVQALVRVHLVGLCWTKGRTRTFELAFRLPDRRDPLEGNQSG